MPGTGSGYVPVDTPPGTAPMPLGTPVPAKPATPAVPRGPRAPRVAKPSGKGRVKKPPLQSRRVRGA
jgi:hypothetical protein